jgi:MoaD family protein
MLVKVKLIGRYKDIAGKQELELEILNGDTIWHVVDVFIKQYPKIEKDKKFIMVSKNNIYTTIDAKIMDGDEITLSPPVVSGG